MKVRINDVVNKRETKRRIDYLTRKGNGRTNEALFLAVLEREREPFRERERSGKEFYSGNGSNKGRKRKRGRRIARRSVWCEGKGGKIISNRNLLQHTF